MTPCSRIEPLCARLLRADTMALIVLPAIADLKFEVRAGTIWPLLRGYAGVWRAVAGAVGWDASRMLEGFAGRLGEADRAALLTAFGVFAAYAAASTLFIVDIRAGAQRLGRSAAVADPVLRSIALLAVAVLFAIVAGFLVLRIRRARGRMATIAAGSAMLLTLATSDGVAAQADALPTQMVTVEGRAMRIWTAGLNERRPGQPVVVLETGADGGPGTFPLDTWRRVFPELARLGPVFAYERKGNGLSEPDTERPTMRRVALVLHQLLTEARVAPPYVLVGQSWGGTYVRAFYDQFPTEVVGMVFIDADTGRGPNREERAAVLLPEERAAALAPPAVPPIPEQAPAGLRLEFEEILKEIVNDGAESRSLRRVTGIPVAVVMATPPGRLRGSMGAVVRLMIQHEVDWLLAMPNSVFVAASHVGHHVHVDDPALVARLVKHVVDHVGVPPRDQRTPQQQR